MSIRISTVRSIGFGILVLCWGFAFFTVGVYSQYEALSGLLWTMYLLGLLTVLGLSMMSARDKEERAFYQKRREREKELKEEIANVQKKKAA